MLKEENAELIIDGKRVENDYTFVADDEEMKVEIAYTFNASELGGKNLVTFEDLRLEQSRRTRKSCGTQRH